MNVQIPNYFSGVLKGTTDAFVKMLHDPTLWSEQIVKETLKRTGSQAFNIKDVQQIIKDYLMLLSESIREGKEVNR